MRLQIPLLKTRSEKIRGGEIISRILAAEGVDTVYGIIDGTYFGLLQSLEPNGIALKTPRHETSAAHMAGAHARLTGKLGVCIASNGPGVANILPGVAVENAEGNRVLLVTSSRREGIAYPDRGGTFQCFPQVEVTRPMSKWSCAVPTVDRLAELTREAMRISFTGRPGVVHLDVPESILNGKFEVDATWFRAPETYRVVDPIVPSERQVDAAIQLLTAAKRPMLHAGCGVVHGRADAELAVLAELLEAPITTSWGARCVVDERTRYAVPMTCIPAVDKARQEADLVLVVGSRLGETDFWGKAPYWGKPETQKIIHVDIDADPIGRNRPCDLGIQADAKELMSALIAKLRARPQAAAPASRRAWVNEVVEARERRRAELDQHRTQPYTAEAAASPMGSADVPSICQEVLGDDAVLIIDGGNTSIWANFFHEVRRPHSIVGTPKMGMLGAGVSQALGAQVACPDKRVYCLIGDGAMGFHQQEIETAVRNDLPVIYIVFCDKQWGMVKINQQFNLKPLKTLLLRELGPDETINTDLHETRFDDLARAMGAHGERVGTCSELRDALNRSVASGKCSVIHVDVDPVKHMWAPNLKTFKDMHAEPAG